VISRERIRLLTEPPQGSKLRAAKDYGFDLTLFETSLLMTVDERLRALEDMQSLADELRRAVQCGKERKDGKA
jgi:hypothetical protein